MAVGGSMSLSAQESYPKNNGLYYGGVAIWGFGLGLLVHGIMRKTHDYKSAKAKQELFQRLTLTHNLSRNKPASIQPSR